MHKLRYLHSSISLHNSGVQVSTRISGMYIRPKTVSLECSCFYSRVALMMEVRILSFFVAVGPYQHNV